MTAIQLYLMANWCYRHKIPLLPYVFYRLIYFINNCHILYSNQIGYGTTISYGGIAVVIHKNARIGKNCTIGPHVTIGGRSNIQEVPIIGNNVWVGSGAAILGNITIGNNVVVGANAVVISSVPDNCSVAGIPAKIIKKDINVQDYCNLPSTDLA